MMNYEERDNVGYFSIMVFLVFLTTLFLFFYENNLVLEYQKFNTNYVFGLRKYLFKLELIYLGILLWTVYVYYQLGYDYEDEFVRLIFWHQTVVFSFTLISQVLIFIIYQISSELEVFEESGGFLGKEIVNPVFYQNLVSVVSFVVPFFLLILLGFSLRVFQMNLAKENI